MVDDRPITRLRDRLRCLSRSRDPRTARALHFRERLFGSRAERRARIEIRDVGDVPAILVAVENVDVIVAHESPFICSP